jgi:CBS domain containing-hemolysin-like protein
MSASEKRKSRDEPPSGSSIGTTVAPRGARSPDSWLSRLWSAVRRRGRATIREDLAEALAHTDDIAAGFTADERSMLANILRLREVRVDDIMVPRADIEAVDIDTSFTDVFAAFRSSGHSRLPVYRETLDDPVGMVHVKDLMGFLAAAAGITHEPKGEGADRPDVAGEGDPPTLTSVGEIDLSRPLADADLVRSILFVPPSMTVSVLLANMQASRMQVALVIDEYGGTDGLVSLEDAIETVVGNIEDEHDSDAGPMIVPDSNGGFLADARAELDEVSVAIGADLANSADGDDVDTVGGLIFALAGRIPVRGELIAVPGGFEFEILDADPRRIKRLRISRRPAGRRTAGGQQGRATK